MSLPTAVIDAMVAAGCSVEQLAAAMKASNAEQDARDKRKREMATERKRRQRSKGDVGHGMSRGQSVTVRDKRDPSSPEGFPPTPPFPKTPSSLPPSPPKGGSSPAEFEKFWEAYPHRVAKKTAKAAFAAARKRVDFETLMAGLARYAAKTDDRPWCNPSTWLNGDRWGDLPASGTTGPDSASASAPAPDWIGRVKVFREHGIWPHAYGPKPGEPGCRAQLALDQDDPLVHVLRRAGHKVISGKSGKAWFPVEVVEKARAEAGAA